MVLECKVAGRPENVRSQTVTEKCHANGSEYTLSFVREDQSTVKEGVLIYSKCPDPSGPVGGFPLINFSYGKATVLHITEEASKLYMEIEMDTRDTNNNRFAEAYLNSVSNIFEALQRDENDRLRMNAPRTPLSERKKSLFGGLKGSVAARSRRREDGDTASSKSNMDQTVYFSTHGE